MDRRFTCSIREVVEKGGLVPQSFEEILEHIHRPGGFWQVIQRDKYTGEIQTEQVLENNWTDNGISQMYDAVLRASTPTQFTPANIMVISATLAMTTLSANIAAGGTVTTIAVAAPTGGSIPSGTRLIIDPGAGHANFAVTLTQTISGAGTFSVASVSGPNSQINSGAYMRYDYAAVPTADPSLLPSPVSYSPALPASQFSKSIATGYGNRQIQVTNSNGFLFSSPAGNYTEAWLSNANPISATNQTVLRVAFDLILSINSTTVGQITCIEKL
jgi:hypothetical protein